MGKTKTAVIDDAAPAEEPKKKQEVASETHIEQEKQSEAKNAESVETKKDGKAGKAKKSKRAVKKGNLKYRSKKYQEAREKVERNKVYPIDEAVQLAKDASYSKFGGTVEIHISTAVKGLRGLVSLPFASGKKLRVLAFGKGAEESGADIVGDDAKIALIQKSKIDFDVVVTTPDWMPRLAKAASVLGPRGLMPNPKSGTISADLKKAVAEIQSGKVEYKSERSANVIHLGIGSVSQPNEELSQNIRMLLNNIGKTKMKKAVISPSMGPSIRIDLSSI